MTTSNTKQTYRILLVDDDADDVSIIRRTLGKREHLLADFQWASSAEEGIELALQNDFDVILLDYYLGSETARDFVKLMPTSLGKVAIVVLTGKSDTRADEDSLGMGVESFLSKEPLVPSLLWQTMRFAVRNKELQNRLSNFAKILAHELTSPAANIASILSLIEMTIERSQLEKASNLIEKAKSESNRISRLVGSLHDYCESKNGALRLEQANLKNVMDEAIASLTVEISERQPEIRLGSLHHCFVDSALMTHVFKNLIQNSLKYNEGEHPQIHIESSEEDDQVLVIVQDNGIGIAPENFERIFRPMERIHRDGSPKGDGLGLAICKEIVERHGGTIRAESAGIGLGSAFHISLPRDGGLDGADH